MNVLSLGKKENKLVGQTKVNLPSIYQGLHFTEGAGINLDEPGAVDEDLGTNGALGHQLRPILQLGVLLLQDLQREPSR